jgi:hypothetical protein
LSLLLDRVYASSLLELNCAAFVNADGSLTLTPAYDICPQPRSVPQANQAMAIGRDGQRVSQLATCLSACETYLLTSAQAQAIIDEQRLGYRPRTVMVMLDEVKLASPL